MGKLRVDIDKRKSRAHQAGDMNGGFSQTEYRNIEQFPQLVQPGIEDVAEEEGVVTLGLGVKAIFQHLGGVEEFEVAILLGNGAMRAQPVDGDLGSRSYRRVDDPLQHLAVGTVARAARHAEALIKQTHHYPSSMPSCGHAFLYLGSRVNGAADGFGFLTRENSLIPDIA